ncbi:putative membrane protein [Hymenobacter sp. UYAg731]
MSRLAGRWLHPSLAFYLRQARQPLRESLWFVPALMVLASFGLAYGVVQFDQASSVQGLRRLPLLFGIDAGGASGMLSAIAGSMLTVAALTFSLLLAALGQVSNQYSPRALRNFMRDRVNQVVLGYFVSVFTYCLVVLGTIRSVVGGHQVGLSQFVPTTAVLLALVLALGGVGALVYFVHHVAEALQTGTLLRTIALETEAEIEALFPDRIGQPVPEAEQAAAQAFVARHGWHAVPSDTAGYLQRVDADGLLRWAQQHRTVVRLNVAVGGFVGEGQPLFSVRAGMERAEAPDAAQTPADWPDDLMRYVGIGRHRNPAQDVAFGLQQLVDVALKALSPAVNDTTTAIMAIDYLGELGGRLARRDFPNPLRSDGRHLRVLVKVPDFDDYIRLAFDLIRANALTNPAVLRRMLCALALIGGQTAVPERRRILREQAGLLLTNALATLPHAYERQQVEATHAELSAAWQ